MLAKVVRTSNEVRFVFDWMPFPDNSALRPLQLRINDALRMITHALSYMYWLNCIAQNGSSEDDTATAVAVNKDGSIVIGGYRANSSTYIAVKLDAEGTFEWQWEVSRRGWWETAWHTR